MIFEATFLAVRSRASEFVVVVFLVGVSCVRCAVGAAESGMPGLELVRDPHFSRGFHLLHPTPGRRVVCGRLAPMGSEADPVWDLAQWSSRFPLIAGPASETGHGAARWSNAAKSVTVGGGGANRADLALAVNASQEYAAGARKSGEPWVHLLVQQNFTNSPSLGEIGTARLRIEARLIKSRLHRTPDYTPDLHAAQYQMFLTLQNSNRRSPGFGRFVWFGIPLYDDRARIPREHKQRDTAGSDMFIYTPSGELFSRRSAHDGEWVHVDRDLRPLLIEALETAWGRGFLDETRDLADYRLTGMNLGWEVPGVLDVELAVRGLSLTVTTVRAPGP
ncbi:MAG: hypothetical protein QM845_04460 [Verrucomicrobiota bacterium]|nr:hypothetical protein [Verrucomicrobiota bacterium]